MFSNIFTGLTGIWRYISAGLAIAVVVLIGVVSFQSVRLSAANARLDASDVKLSVSNASVTELLYQNNKVKDDLMKAQTQERLNQEALKQALIESQQKDLSLQSLQKSLRSHTNPSVKTPIDKDIADAFQQL